MSVGVSGGVIMMPNSVCERVQKNSTGESEYRVEYLSVYFICVGVWVGGTIGV